PVAEQASAPQMPVGQAEPQQRPPMQMPLAHWAPPAQTLPGGASVVAVVELVVATVDVVVLVATISGAQSIFGTLGATCRSPNWSCHWSGASVAFGHLSL